MSKQTIGEFLQTLRKANGYTQQDVAEKLNVSNRTISGWETDRSAPDLYVLPAIADLYGVTVDEILRGERTNNTSAESCELSENAKRGLAKKRYVNFTDKRILFTSLAAVGAVMWLVAGWLFLYSNTASWVLLLLEGLGLADVIVFLSLLFYAKYQWRVEEGIILDQDIKSSDMVKFLRINMDICKSIRIIALLFWGFSALFLFLLLVINPQTQTVEMEFFSITFYPRDAYWAVIRVYAFLATAFSVMYIICHFVSFNKFADETQRQKRKFNMRLFGKLCVYGAIPLVPTGLVLLIACLVPSGSIFLSYLFLVLAGLCVASWIALAIIFFVKRQKQKYEF